MTAFDPGGHGGPVQPHRQPRHAADPVDLRRRRGRGPARRARPGDRARRSGGLLRRRDRADRLHRPGRARGLPVVLARDLERGDPRLPARRLPGSPRARRPPPRHVPDRRGGRAGGRLAADGSATRSRSSPSTTARRRRRVRVDAPELAGRTPAIPPARAATRRRSRPMPATAASSSSSPPGPGACSSPEVSPMSIVTPAWVKDAVFYQVFPDRFARSGRVEAPGPLEDWDSPPTVHGFKGGDLYGVAERLDDLADLGVTAIYLNPVFSSASNHRYHTYDYLAVDPMLGGDAALRELLDAAHARGMRVILDGVFNHASRGFWPFNHVLECGIASPYVDWFHVDRDALAGGRPLRAYPDESMRDAADGWGGADGFGTEISFSLGYRAWWNLPALPKLNTDNPQVREYLMRVAEHWIRFGADGWRLDVAAEIDDDEFWREFRRRVKAIDPDAYIVAEVWNEDQRWLQGDQFDAYMNYPLAFAILSFAAGRPPRPGRDRRPSRGPQRRPRRERLGVPGPGRAPAADLRPRGGRGPAEPARQPRHGPDPHDLRRGHRRRPAGDARADDAARCAVHLLRRRGRHGGRPRPVVPRRVPERRGRRRPGDARLRAGRRPAATPGARAASRVVRDRRAPTGSRPPTCGPTGRTRSSSASTRARSRRGSSSPCPAGTAPPSRRSRRRAGRGRCRTSAPRCATDERGSACRRGVRRSCA